MNCPDFTCLTPDIFLPAVEDALDIRLTGLAHPLTSYINRVYELQTVDGKRIIAKFYRPGRWTEAGISQEHRFVQQCAEAEIPVAMPLSMGDGTTLGQVSDIFFTTYEKKLGREFEPLTPEDWRRLGRVLGRLHVIGDCEDAPDRVYLHPEYATADAVEELLAGEFVATRHRADFESLTETILDKITPLFEDMEMIRIHGDSHRGNLLERPGEGILVIDFDDMAVGPPVQDLWMLLPAHARDCRREINLILEGYEDFRQFDDRSLVLIEPLRIMRLLYFLAWCSRQVGDTRFERTFPDWGSEPFWRQQIGDLRHQMDVICRVC